MEKLHAAFLRHAPNSKGMNVTQSLTDAGSSLPSSPDLPGIGGGGQGSGSGGGGDRKKWGDGGDDNERGQKKASIVSSDCCSAPT